MIIMEWDHLRKCRSEYRRKYAKSLRQGATLPCRATCIKIMRVIVALMSDKLRQRLVTQQADLGNPHTGAQDDIWSMRNCRESYGCLRLSMIIEWQQQLVDVNPLLAFRVFQSSSHTGAVIATWKRSTCGEWNLDPVKSIRLWTEDGASNNIKSSKILGANYEICGPHNFQRANQFALGLAGSTSQNPQGKALVRRMSRQSSSFHSSGVASKALQDSQIDRGVKAASVKSTEVANITRWTGIFRCAQKSRLLEGDIKFALTGEADGMCAEQPAEIVVDGDSSNEAGSDAGGEAGEAAADEQEVESDAEQVRL